MISLMDNLHKYIYEDVIATDDNLQNNTVQA